MLDFLTRPMTQLGETPEDISLHFSIVAGETRSLEADMGIRSAAHYDRNYVTTSMTTQAIEELIEEGCEQITILEPGMGTGINLVAAVLAAKDRVPIRAIGIEKSQNSLKFANKMVEEYGLSSKIEIIEGDMFDQDLSEVKADVLILEHLSHLLQDEKELQLPAANHFQQYTHEKTKYVPLGIDFFINPIKKEFIGPVELGKIRFNRPYGDMFSLQSHVRFNTPTKQIRIQGNVIGPNGKPINYFRDIDYLRVSQTVPLEIKQPGDYLISLTWGTTKNNHQQYSSVTYQKL